MWNKTLNINAQLLNQEWQVYMDNQNNGNYQISRRGWIGDYVDPNSFLDMFITDGGNNKTGFSSVRYDEIILQEAPAAKTREERFRLFHEAETILMEQMPGNGARGGPPAPTARRPPPLSSSETARRMASLILCIGSGTPITPVEARKISLILQPSALAAKSAVSATLCLPLAPVKALALPELTSSARALPPGKRPRHQSTAAEGRFPLHDGNVCLSPASTSRSA